MKPITFLPPVIALAISIGWIGTGRRSIVTLENESALLEKHIAAARSASIGDDPSHSKTGSAAKATKGKEPIDWKKLVARMEEMQRGGGMGDMRSMMRLQQQVQAMSRDEIVAALDEIAALGLPDQSRMMLEQMLMGPLVQKDPEFALTKFIDQLGDDRGGMRWQLSNAFQEWAKKDPTNAIAWFDQQIAAGKFESKSLDGKSRSRIEFEGMLIGALVSGDPTAAAARLKALPLDQRADALLNNGNLIKDEDQRAYADLVRGGLPAEEQARAIAQQAYTKAWGEGYTQITEYLDRIQATPAERAASVEQAAESKIQQLSQKKKITREDIDTLREWATAQSPETTGKVTGSALARSTQVNQKLAFSDAAALAAQYHEASGNDDVLVSFLTQGAGNRNKEEARVLALKISDPKRRDEVLDKLK